MHALAVARAAQAGVAGSQRARICVRRVNEYLMILVYIFGMRVALYIYVYLLYADEFRVSRNRLWVLVFLTHLARTVPVMPML